MNNNNLKPFCGYPVTVTMKAGDTISGVLGDITDDEMLLILPRNKLVHLPMSEVTTITLRRGNHVLTRDKPPWRQETEQKNSKEMVK